MPFAPDDIRIDVVCGRGDDDRWHCGIRISVEATALRRLGLHPDQISTGQASTGRAWG
jgi:hypothetical protein